jgi:hypothetical protein
MGNLYIGIFGNLFNCIFGNLSYCIFGNLSVGISRESLKRRRKPSNGADFADFAGRERWGFRPYLLVFQADAERSFCHPDSGRVNNLISNLANPALSAAAARGILSFQSSVFQVDKTVGPLVATCKFKVRFFGKTRRDVFLSVARRVAAPSVRDVSRASAAGYGNPGTAVASALFRNSKCDQFYSRCHF